MSPAPAPGDRETLLLRALERRRAGDVEGALVTLAALEQLQPRFSRLHEERGHCYAALQRPSEAIAAFLEGVRINPALPASWRMLESLYRTSGEEANAATAAAHLATLAALPPEVVTATALFSDGELGPAEELVRRFLVAHGHHVEAMRLLARIGIARGAFDDAQLLLEAVLDLAPGYHAARLDYARLLLERHRHTEAQAQAVRLLAADPGSRDYRAVQALSCVGLGQHEQAIGIYQGLLPGAAQPAELHLSIGHAHKTLGRGAQAVAAYRAAAGVRPDFGDAWWSLANLKTYRFTPGELEQMRAAQAAPATGAVDRIHLCFALGKALEDRGEYAESFQYYERGNGLRRGASRYRPEILEQNTRAQIEVCTPELFRRHRASGVRDCDPIFIVGLPRSGSTLIEQILASHSLVEGTHELVEVTRLVAQLRGRNPDPTRPRYPALLRELDAADLRRLGEQYLADTRAYRGGKPRFIDKMPNNFRHLGLIHLMLPGAKIIDARREPMACCLGILKQLFASGQEFAYGVADVARYYRTYLELMRHWEAAMPGCVLRVQYEDLVEDLEGGVRALLAHCGLEFESGCLEFHRTERSIRSASSEQVRRPLNRDGLGQWQHYEPWLGNLRVALGDALTRYREPPAQR
ncbi:MAG: sulfotransferase [Steroidobacteraceae bacterium]